MKNQLFLFIALVFSLLITPLSAQDGTHDTNYGTAGYYTPSGAGTNDLLSSLIIQSDGNILLGGSVFSGSPGFRSLYFHRIKLDGSVDNGFNTGNPVKIFIKPDKNNFGGMAIQSDGSIVYSAYVGDTTAVSAGKLTSDGQTSIAPLPPFFLYTPGGYYPPQNIFGLSYNKINKNTTIGGYISNNPAYIIGAKFREDLSFNTTFNSLGKIAIGILPALKNCRAVINMDNGSTLLAGTTTSGSIEAFAIIKLKPNGNFDSTFATNGVATIVLGTSVNCAPYAMDLLPDGNILVAGSVGSNMGMFKLTSSGTMVPAAEFTPVIYSYSNTNIGNSIVLQPDKKILLSGTATGTVNAGVVVRVNENGSIDPTFGASGVAVIPNMDIRSADIYVKDKMLYVAGKNILTNKMVVARVKYSAQALNILGKDIVSVSSENTYTINPILSTAYTYQWSYGSPNIFSSTTADGDSITLFFKSDTPSDTLTCIIRKSGVMFRTLKKAIKVNQEPTLAEMLEEVKCDITQTNCINNYINTFSIGQTKLKSQNTGCSPTGYYDFTSSGNYDTLYLGDNYQAILECKHNSGSLLYGGVWIDFNNDGKINDAREFVGSSFTTGNLLEINNMLVPEDIEVGPKRVRVRVSNKGPFTTNDFCPTNDTEAETEDYLIVLNNYEGLKTPNFITPNDDGKNDLFVVRGGKTNIGNSLKVFNRVGDLVFEIENYDNTWAGKDKTGAQLKAGTYYYVFTQPSNGKAKDDVVKGFLEIRY